MNRQSIFHIPQKKPNAKLRIICFPYAGGSTSVYSLWSNNLHPDAELVLVQMPGRGGRLAERPYKTMSALVKDIFTALTNLAEKPFVLYGHSLGARVAYEVMLMLHKNQCRLPIHVVASGSPAPFFERKKEQTYHLPDAEFIEHIRGLKGTPEEVLQNHDLMQLVLPGLRADFEILETYCNLSRQKNPIGVSVFAGKQDDIALAELEAWNVLFEYNSEVHWFDGGHFFIHDNNNEVLLEVNHLIGKFAQMIR